MNAIIRCSLIIILERCCTIQACIRVNSIGSQQKQTAKDKLTLKADGTGELKWYVDASFAVHPDFRSHTGATITMGKGAITSLSRKQGMNTHSSTEAEVVAADEVVGPMLWTKLFLEQQGYPVWKNMLFQDNRSAMLLEENGRKSAGK